METERLVLRKPQPSDIDAWTVFYASDRATFMGGGSGKDTLAWRVWAMFLGHWQIQGTGPFVACLKETGQPIGTIGPWFPRGWPEHELSWSIWTPEHEGLGYASEAVRPLQKHVIRDLGWKRAVSYIDPDNHASIGLAERVGCWRDPEAATPGGEPALVYVHPI